MSGNQSQTASGTTGDQPRATNGKTRTKSNRKRRTKAQLAAARPTPVGAPPASVTTIKPTAARAAAMAVRASNAGPPPALMMDLVHQLPTAGAIFSKEQRAAWLAAGTAILDVLYPIAPIAKAA